MAFHSGTNLKSQQLLEAAWTGNLERLKNLAAELDDGKGLAQTIVDIKQPKDGVTALHIAGINGNLELFKYLVDDLKLDFESKDGKGFTPLHHAASEGHKSLVQALLSRGANVHSKAADRGTPLNRAAGSGSPEAVAILLSHHADPNIGLDEAFTPLSASIIAQSLACVALLIEAGADPNAVAIGESPLYFATCERETEMIKCLLKAGADPNVTNELGITPLELAAWKGYHQEAQILFPVTSPIPTYSDWSIGGIMRNLHEGNKINLKVMEAFNERKSNGKDAFQRKKYYTATLWYTKALEIYPNDAIVLSNRSLCWACEKDGDNALCDAVACLMFAPEWPKAYYRTGAAYTILEDFDRAVDAFSVGLKLAPKDKELQNALREATEAKIKSTKA